MGKPIGAWGPWIVVALGWAELGHGHALAQPEAASPFRNLSIFARALTHVETSYVDPADQDRLVYGAIRGLVATLDPHSTFLDPDEYRTLSDDTQGRFGGVGLEVDVRDGWLTVVATFDGAPAARAGIRPGDRFLSIAGRDARDMRIEEAVRLMRGEPGSTVEVRVRRGAESSALVFSLSREVIRVRAVEARVLPDGVVYVRVKVFQETTTAELRAALDRAVAELRDRGGVRGVLFDLRDNPGGLLDEAVLVSDEFLGEGVVVSTRGRDGRLLSEARSVDAGTRPAWPMVVLVNGFTASAAEIVAGALRDHRRAVLVGTRTFGKGSVQNVIELPDGSALKLTIARYYTPSGGSIQARGIEPDVVVEQLDASALRALTPPVEPVREAGLERHLEREAAAGTPASSPREGGRNEPREAPGEGVAVEPPFPDDFQARMAHQALRAIVVATAARVAPPR